MIRRTLFATALGLMTLSALPTAAQAPTHRPFTQAAFAQAQAAGSAILIDVWAPWCPTCRAQQPVINELAVQPANRNLVIFRVDFDNQKDVVRGFRAQRQATLIAFKGQRETARLVGVTDRAQIGTLIASTRTPAAR